MIKLLKQYIYHNIQLKTKYNELERNYNAALQDEKALNNRLKTKDMVIKGLLKEVEKLTELSTDERIDYIINNYQCKSIPEETEQKEYVPVTVEERR